MDGTRCAATPTTDSAHADGRALLAVAEGDAQNPPSDAVVAHIFSCERCSAHVRELRSGLLGLASAKKTTPSSKSDAAAATRPAGPRAGAAMTSVSLDDVGDLGDGSTELAALDEEEATIERARMLVWKLAVVGGVFAVALYFARFFAASLH